MMKISGADNATKALKDSSLYGRKAKNTEEQIKAAVMNSMTWEERTIEIMSYI